MSPLLSIQREVTYEQFVLDHPNLKSNINHEPIGYVLADQSLAFLAKRLKVPSIVQFGDQYFNPETFSKIDNELVQQALVIKGIYHLNTPQVHSQFFEGTKEELDEVIGQLAVGSYGILKHTKVQSPRTCEFQIRFKVEEGVKGSMIHVFPNRYHFLGINPICGIKQSDSLKSSLEFFRETFDKLLKAPKNAGVLENKTLSGVLKIPVPLNSERKLPHHEFLLTLEPNFKLSRCNLDDKVVVLTEELSEDYRVLFVDIMKWNEYPMTKDARRFGLDWFAFRDAKIAENPDPLLLKIVLDEPNKKFRLFGDVPFIQTIKEGGSSFEKLTPDQIKNYLGVYHRSQVPHSFRIFEGDYEELQKRLTAGCFAIRYSVKTKAHILNFKNDSGEIKHQILKGLDVESVTKALNKVT